MEAAVALLWERTVVGCAATCLDLRAPVAAASAGSPRPPAHPPPPLPASPPPADFLRLFCISFTKKRPGQVKKTAYAQSSQVRATERWGAWHAFYENRLGRDGCVDAAAGSCSCSCTCAAARLRASPRDTIPNPGRQPSHPVLLPTAAHCTPQLPLHPCTASARRSAPSAARWLRS